MATLRIWRSSQLKLLRLQPHKPILSSFKTTSYKPSAPRCFSSTTRIGTHNGSFHCDEALGCFLLRLTPKFADSHVIRTRDTQVLDSLDAVLDVGGVYDPSRDRYDHHQKGFDEVFGHGFGTKLSSAGLVYKHYGMGIIARKLQLDQGHPHIHSLFLAVYKNFVQAIDAADNGINQYDTNLSPKYVVNTYLSSRVGRLNLDWTDPDQSAEREDAAFQKAMTLAGNEFLETIHFHAKSWLPARSIVMECLDGRHNIDSSGEIMVLRKSCPFYAPTTPPPKKSVFVISVWKLHIFELEEAMKVESSIKYVIYEDDRRTSWRVQAVPIGPDKFDSWKPLPSHWRGLEGKELSVIAGIPGCVFVHMSGFIGGNQTYEGALDMARASLKA